eukprot:93672-Amphidinium_carterae.1
MKQIEFNRSSSWHGMRDKVPLLTMQPKRQKGRELLLWLSRMLLKSPQVFSPPAAFALAAF